MEYSSFERVKSALAHKEADRIPFDLGATGQTGINKIAYSNLRKYLGMEKTSCEISDILQQLARVDEDLIEKLKVDVVGINPSGPIVKGRLTDVNEEGSYYKLVDEWGIKWKMPIEHGHYFDMYEAPLQDITFYDDIKSYKIPDGADEGRFITLRKQVDECVGVKERAFVLGRHYAGIFETASWLRGMENFLCDMAIDRGLAEGLLDLATENKIQYWKKAIETAGENVLVVAEADDLATQNSLLISKDMYRKIIKPRHKRLCEAIRKAAGRNIGIFFHCCGAVKELIPDLIEAGFDILNPIQVSASEIDTKELKRLFGKDIIFWGGGCDTQYILPRGTIQEVKDETKRRIEDLAPGGGFIFATVHNIQSDVPPQNIMAMWETFMEYNKY